MENVWNRHNTNAMKLWNGLESLGMELHVSKEYRLPTLTTVKIPPAVDGDGFRNHLLRNFGIEIGNGLGELSGKVWRIGLMGFNSSGENVDRLLNLFDTELKKYSIRRTIYQAAQDVAKKIKKIPASADFEEIIQTADETFNNQMNLFDKEYLEYLHKLHLL